jgi:hypothetical protein
LEGDAVAPGATRRDVGVDTTVLTTRLKRDAALERCAARLAPAVWVRSTLALALALGAPDPAEAVRKTWPAGSMPPSTHAGRTVKNAMDAAPPVLTLTLTLAMLVRARKDHLLSGRAAQCR